MWILRNLKRPQVLFKTLKKNKIKLKRVKMRITLPFLIDKKKSTQLKISKLVKKTKRNKKQRIEINNLMILAKIRQKM
jgi:hypothetical protein